MMVHTIPAYLRPVTHSHTAMPLSYFVWFHHTKEKSTQNKKVLQLREIRLVRS